MVDSSPPKTAKMAYKLLKNKHVTNKILRQAEKPGFSVGCETCPAL